MKMIKAVTEEEYIEKLVTHEDPGARIMGRFVATGVRRQIKAFMRNEVKRGSDPGYLVDAMVSFFGSMSGEFAMDTVDPPAAAKAILGRFEEVMQGFLGAQEEGEEQVDGED